MSDNKDKVLNLKMDKKSKTTTKIKDDKNNYKIIIRTILSLYLIFIIYRNKDEIFKIIKSKTIESVELTKDSTSCKDIDPKVDCINWKQSGHCEKSPAYMVQHCASTCEICHLVNPEVRCKKFYSNPRVFKDNEMDVMFHNLVQSYTGSCNTVNSNEGKTDACSITNSSSLTVISRDPWIVTIDNFISAEEAATIISIPLKKLGFNPHLLEHFKLMA